MFDAPFTKLVSDISADQISTSQCGMQLLETVESPAVGFTPPSNMPTAIQAPRTLYDKIWDDHVMWV